MATSQELHPCQLVLVHNTLIQDKIILHSCHLSENCVIASYPNVRLLRDRCVEKPGLMVILEELWEIVRVAVDGAHLVRLFVLQFPVKHVDWHPAIAVKSVT